MTNPRMSRKVRDVYGNTNPRELWNASFAASPDKWAVGSLAAMCTALAPPQSGSVAIVGNGPLTAGQRKLIKASDRVVRFNAVNNM